MQVICIYFLRFQPSSKRSQTITNDQFIAKALIVFTHYFR